MKSRETAKVSRSFCIAVAGARHPGGATPYRCNRVRETGVSRRRQKGRFSNRRFAPLVPKNRPFGAILCCLRYASRGARLSFTGADTGESSTGKYAPLTLHTAPRRQGFLHLEIVCSANNRPRVRIPLSPPKKSRKRLFSFCKKDAPILASAGFRP